MVEGFRALVRRQLVFSQIGEFGEGNMLKWSLHCFAHPGGLPKQQCGSSVAKYMRINSAVNEAIYRDSAPASARCCLPKCPAIWRPRHTREAPLHKTTSRSACDS